MALYYFIMSLLGAPLMIAGYWGLARPALRWWRERRWRKLEWDEVAAARVLNYTDPDALQSAYGALRAVYSAPSADASGAASRMSAMPGRTGYALLDTEPFNPANAFRFRPS